MKTTRLYIRLSEGEKRQMMSLAKESGKKLSEYVLASTVYVQENSNVRTDLEVCTYKTKEIVRTNIDKPSVISDLQHKMDSLSGSLGLPNVEADTKFKDIEYLEECI